MKITLTILLSLVLSIVSAQDAKPMMRATLQGGIWSGTNGRTLIVGVPAAKLSVMFTISEKTRLETGLMLIPGLISDKTDGRLGLSAGGTVTIRKDAWKLKPVIGVVLVKTDTWQLMPGIGFVF